MKDMENLGISNSNEESPKTNELKITSDPTLLHENDSSAPHRHLQFLLDARGIGADLANGEDLAYYIRRLREGWD